MFYYKIRVKIHCNAQLFIDVELIINVTYYWFRNLLFISEMPIYRANILQTLDIIDTI